jgi:hypothetical protein
MAWASDVGLGASSSALVLGLYQCISYIIYQAWILTPTRAASAGSEMSIRGRVPDVEVTGCYRLVSSYFWPDS